MSDLISRQALCEYAFNQKDKCVTPNDIMRFPSTQPETHDKRTETHECDLISRQAAIDAAKELCLHYTPTKSVKHPHIDFVVEELERLPSAHQRWIPCSERLPEANGRYLVTRGLNACGALWNRVYIINYTDLMGLKSGRIWWDGNVGKSDFEQIADVIAWMPLQKPYGGESE